MVDADALAQHEAASLRSSLVGKASTIHSNKDLFELLGSNGITGVGKEETWSRALIQCAIAHREFSARDVRAGARRPVVEAVEVLVRMQDVGFLRSLEREKVDAATGRSVARNMSDDA